MNLQHLCSQVIQIVVQTGKFIQQQQKKISFDNIEKKGLNDFVTYVDKEAEKRLVDFLKPLVKGAGFVTEEKTIPESKQEYTWIIDPLDGTTNFIHGLSPYAISIALQRNQETILGIVYEISLDEIFYSYEGTHAYLNDKPIKVSKADSINQSLIATGFPYNDFSRLDNYMKSLNYFMHHSHGVRRLGSAATDLAYVACGRFEAFYEYSLEPWDVAAGGYIVQKAGGKVGDFNNKNQYVYGGEIVATNGLLHDDFMSIVQAFMNTKQN
ncbi:MAG: inositol monophosphatase family protein [Bacteroidales bacterium]|jgi:myo-inositol-1(or 4)-monophosphatase|nr:inositol monophosphatase family protein [Bacteroidales bacterium]